jgi:hypothetical protein
MGKETNARPMAKSCAQNVAIDGDGTGMGGQHEENDLGLKTATREKKREKQTNKNDCSAVYTGDELLCKNRGD